jgi:hypothetical protein
MVQHDVCITPALHAGSTLISGTKGTARKWPGPARIATSHHGAGFPRRQFNALQEKYTPEITRRVGEMARLVGGHGGMDTLMDWRLIDCLQERFAPRYGCLRRRIMEFAVIPLKRMVCCQPFTDLLMFPILPAARGRPTNHCMDIMLQNGGNTKLV